MADFQRGPTRSNSEVRDQYGPHCSMVISRIGTVAIRQRTRLAFLRKAGAVRPIQIPTRPECTMARVRRSLARARSRLPPGGCGRQGGVTCRGPMRELDSRRHRSRMAGMAVSGAARPPIGPALPRGRDIRGIHSQPSGGYERRLPLSDSRREGWPEAAWYDLFSSPLSRRLSEPGCFFHLLFGDSPVSA